jgi:hypothetical protein
VLVDAMTTETDTHSLNCFWVIPLIGLVEIQWKEVLVLVNKMNKNGHVAERFDTDPCIGGLPPRDCLLRRGNPLPLAFPCRPYLSRPHSCRSFRCTWWAFFPPFIKYKLFYKIFFPAA